tara:strand:+ start:138 stop:833 length:696 start_codon:yes stop_codon:yes gene_type:complete
MKTIVLIPGYMCDEQIWINQIVKLKKKYKVIIPSLKRGNTIKAFSSSTLKLLPKKFSIVGFSMGGFIALDLAINYSKRVEDLILVGTNARAVSKDRRRLLKKSQDELNNKNYIEKFSLSSFKSYIGKNNQKNKSYLKLIISMVKNHSLLCLKRQSNAILKRPSLLNKLSKITSRCLIIVGSDDKLSSKEMNIELKKNIRGSELFFIKQSGHFVMIEQSKKFNKLFFKWLKY